MRRAAERGCAGAGYPPEPPEAIREAVDFALRRLGSYLLTVSHTARTTPCADCPLGTRMSPTPACNAPHGVGFSASAEGQKNRKVFMNIVATDEWEPRA